MVGVVGGREGSEQELSANGNNMKRKNRRKYFTLPPVILSLFS